MLKTSKIILSLFFAFGFINIANAQNADAPKPVAIENNDAQIAFDAALKAKQAGEMAKAAKLFQTAYENAPKTPEGARIAIESAKSLGFYFLENQDLRRAESHFTAETTIARKLYFSGAINAKPFTDAVKHWASASGLLMRSNESAALMFYANEIKKRELAALSSQILNRDAIFAADSIEGIKIDAGAFCAIEFVPYLKAQSSCDEEKSAKTEALSLQARQIKADAPKPISKEERAAKEKKSKGEE